MAWDSEEHSAITLARLKVAPPDMVYAALRDYGDYIHSQINGTADDSLEATLLARDDPLINLGLAQFGASNTTVAALYKRGFALRSSDLESGRGLQVACLANRIVPQMRFSSFFGDIDGIDPVEFRRLANEGDWDEICALLANPSAGEVLQALYNRKPPFDDISDHRRRDLVYASIKNPRINVDKSDVDGPDLLAWDIQKGIYNLLQTAPIEASWQKILHSLLSNIDPSATRIPDTDPQEVLTRWGELKVENTFENQDEDAEGWATSLSLVDEFRCLIAALYGRKFEDKTIKQIGGPDDLDVALRCAFYGNGSLTIDQMRAGYQRDEKVFVFAALLNDSLYYRFDCRAELEGLIFGNLRFMYAWRCKQIHSRRPSFDLHPISESGAMLLDDVIEKKQSEEMTTLTRIEAQIALLKERIGSVSKMATWGFVILLAILIITKH